MTERISSCVMASVPSPGPTTMARHFPVAARKASAQRGPSRCTRTASVGQAAAGFPGFPRRIMPAPAAMAPRVHRMAEPSMPTEPDAMPSAVLHLCDWRGAGGTPAATSASSISAAPDVARADADVRHLHRAAAVGSGTLQEAGLVGREGHRAGGAEGRARGGPGVGVHAGRRCRRRGPARRAARRARRRSRGTRCRRRHRSPGRTGAARPARRRRRSP